MLMLFLMCCVVVSNLVYINISDIQIIAMQQYNRRQSMRNMNISMEVKFIKKYESMNRIHLPYDVVVVVVALVFFVLLLPRRILCD